MNDVKLGRRMVKVKYSGLQSPRVFTIIIRCPLDTKSFVYIKHDLSHRSDSDSDAISRSHEHQPTR